MKKKTKKTKAKKIKEFRYHNVYTLTKNGKIKKLRHPTYAFLLIGNTFVYVVITHSKIVNGLETIELRINPKKEKRIGAKPLKKTQKIDLASQTKSGDWIH